MQLGSLVVSAQGMTDTARLWAEKRWMADAKMDCDLDEAAVNAAEEAWNSAIRLWNNCDAILELIRNVMERFCAHVKACTDGDQSSRHCHLPIFEYLKYLKNRRESGEE